MASVRPTFFNRIAALDVMRGVSILGILLANITAFATPTLAKMLTGASAVEGMTRSEVWLYALHQCLVYGKFRGMLAILFGVGLYLQFTKRQSAGDTWPGRYMRRTAWLIAFGACHLLFIWFGDILFLYGVTALIAALMVRMEGRKLLWVAGALLGASLLMAIGQQAMIGMLGASPDASMEFFTAAQETEIYQTGPYWQQLAVRAVFLVVMVFQLPFVVPGILGLFLIGIYLGREGVLAAPSRHPRIRNLCLGVGFGLGLPLNALGLLVLVGDGQVDPRLVIDFGLSPILALGYLMLGAVLVERGVLKPVQRAFANVGRMAFTCYILQSLIATTVFYSWGFGYFGRLDLYQQMYVALGIMAVNLIVANLWMRWFAIGPLEWLWRTLSEGTRAPWRAASATTTAGPIAPPPPSEVGGPPRA